MDRKDLQDIAKLRLNEAEILLQQGAYSGAYYLAGYSIECGLKACIAKQIREHEFPDRRFILDSYTHDLDKLLNVSGLKTALNEASEENPELDINWSIIKDWTVDSRYEHIIGEQKAKDLFEAITAEKNGILQWLRKRW